MKVSINDNMHEQLVKYLLKEASVTERKEVETWLGEHRDHKQYMEQLERVWLKSKTLSASIEVDEEEAWQRFQQRRDALPVVSFRNRKMNWVRVAAVLLLTAGLGLGYFWWNQSSGLILSQNEVRTHTLPDGSVVTLNKYSSLEYTSSFKNGERRVSLEGEAFFEIAPDKNHPFIVKANDVSIKVTGTSFNISTNRFQTEVLVETGSVNVSSKGYALQLKANEKTIFLTADSSRPSKMIIDNKLHNYYRTRQFICDGTPLKDLIEMLNKAYNVNIVVDKKVEYLPITTTFQQESLEDILKVIAETFNLQVVKTADKIILK